jgi:thiol-disulfide isomerase/thioredoxin
MMYVAAILLMMFPAPGENEPQSTPLKAQCDALFQEFTDAYLKWLDATHGATTPEEIDRFPRPDGAAYARKFMTIAREHPDDAVAPVALAHAIRTDPFGEFWGEAIDRLAARHVQSPDIGDILSTIAFDRLRPEIEPLLRRILQENPSRQVRARAAAALAYFLLRIIPGEKDFQNRDDATIRHEAESYLDLLKRDYADLPYNQHQGTTFGGYADATLRELHDLIVGKPAPQIEGLDADGKPLKLSDYRGKVVVLVWWASWCGPCLAMVPHERELAERYKDRPFVILGINGDEHEDRMRQQIKEHEITWRSWVDGGPDGPISTFWNVKSWPTVYVLDADGIILYKGGRNEAALDRAIERALTKAVR